LSRGETVSFTEKKERKDGSKYWTEVVVTPIDYEGREANLSINRDISERRELQRKQKLVSFSLDQASVEIYWIKPDGKFVYTNEKVKESLGYSEKELADMYVWDIDPNPEHAKDKREERWKKLKQEEVLNFESDHLTKEGETFPVEISSHYVKYGDNEYEFAFAKDITERKESRRQLQQSEEELRQSFIELAETTSRVLGVRDPYTREHEQRVAELAEEVGRRMGLDEDKLLGLYLGGVLHDIGKIAIPETILTKPGELKDVEWQMIKSHPKVGYNQILEDTDFPWPVSEMALHHHERLDGSGYPHGLEGDELSLEVRILGAVDVVEAMSTRRPYRAARSKEQTLDVLQEGRGDKFDPEVVDVLVDLIDEGIIKFG
jgi:PAS domain S-box-containing protein